MLKIKKPFPKLLKGVSADIEGDYEMGNILGEGSFAKVLKGKNRKSRLQVAIKFIDKASVVSDFKQVEALFSEIAILMNLKHPNIIRLLDVYETTDKLCLVMELANGGELFDRIIERGSYSERDASMLMLSLFRAVKYLHDRGVAHRDLKPENILFESNLPNSAVKISDFGLSKVIDSRKMMSTCCGTPGYVSPEVLTMQGYGPEVDMWSLGVLMYVLLCGFPPFYDDNENMLLQQIIVGRYDFPSPYWDNISPLAKDLVSRLLVVDPKKRVTAAQALMHGWFTSALPTHQLQTKKKLEEQKENRAKKHWKAAGMVMLVGSKGKK